MTAQEWIEAYAAQIGAQAPSADQVEAILDLAGVAAHASERKAAPVACWIAATAGLEPGAALAAAKQVPGVA